MPQPKRPRKPIAFTGPLAGYVADKLKKKTELSNRVDNLLNKKEGK